MYSGCMAKHPSVVVVVEDEFLIRLHVVNVLTNDGFEVIEADNSDEALAILRKHHEAVQVLFTDVHMPGEMDGLALAHHARQHWPQLGILIASGQARLAKEDLPAGSRFLNKPYQSQHVVKHVRELVNVA